ncbi:MAG: DUF427 domain-containing protein [Xanthomonadales bacterium]|nr:DUF427 domain-containing protein [Xanthomonadales bacterium]NIN60393.1 DUF427 domain-containing protein [Xanthomonadales bacterium]NIN75746.1 DUF427 domain-containing protein [Xanthomonadales bacterium]NIO14308.1 DUF427 domain-containing protein [Xanthomonadales bacterium]NIP12786.1 DUF427 domain-containing protein [Xanthomonadales bacterium]
MRLRDRLVLWARRLTGRVPGWRYRGQSRPPFAAEPGPGQESVWDYPRPPCLAPDERRVEVRAAGAVLARTHRAIRVLETASPPTFYIPPDDVDMQRLQVVPGASFCEWKGAATYWGLRDDPDAGFVGWSYEHPLPAFAAIRGHLAFYPDRLECRVNGEIARGQGGRFYGGWITSEVVGPFKGEPGTGDW